jgi:hypothetical protein
LGRADLNNNLLRRRSAVAADAHVRSVAISCSDVLPPIGPFARRNLNRSRIASTKVVQTSRFQAVRGYWFDAKAVEPDTQILDEVTGSMPTLSNPTDGWRPKLLNPTNEVTLVARAAQLWCR